MWSALIPNPELAEVAAEDVRLEWDEDRKLLRVSDRLQADVGFDKLVTLLLGMWRFQAFSDSRWVTIWVK